MKKSIYQICVLFALLFIFTSCSQTDQQVDYSNNMDNTELEYRLSKLNSSIMDELCVHSSRGDKPEQQPDTDTTKVVMADIVGAVDGAKDGARFGIWGAVIGAVVKGAIASYIASYQLAFDQEHMQYDSALIAYPQFIKVCDKVLSHDSTYLNLKDNKDVDNNLIDSLMLVGSIHNVVLDSLKLYSGNSNALNNYQLVEIDSIFNNSFQADYDTLTNYMQNHSILSYNVDLGIHANTVMTSFKTVFRQQATSATKVNTIVNSYISFVKNDTEFLSNLQKTTLIKSFGVAKKSYDYWAND